MRVLAIDTALEACSAAVLDTASGKLTSESLPMVRGHAEALMPLIGRVMKAADVAFSALDRIAVTTGPGSFTGLRVGIAAARGIGLAATKPVVGLTTPAAIHLRQPSLLTVLKYPWPNKFAFTHRDSIGMSRHFVGQQRRVRTAYHHRDASFAILCR